MGNNSTAIMINTTILKLASKYLWSLYCNCSVCSVIGRVFMCVYMYIYVRVYVFVYVYVCVHMCCLSVCVYTCLCICLCVRARVYCICDCLFVCMSLCLCRVWVRVSAKLHTRPLSKCSFSHQTIMKAAVHRTISRHPFSPLPFLLLSPHITQHHQYLNLNTFTNIVNLLQNDIFPSVPI